MNCNRLILFVFLGFLVLTGCGSEMVQEVEEQEVEQAVVVEETEVPQEVLDQILEDVKQYVLDNTSYNDSIGEVVVAYDGQRLADIFKEYEELTGETIKDNTRHWIMITDMLEGMNEEFWKQDVPMMNGYVLTSSDFHFGAFDTYLRISEEMEWNEYERLSSADVYKTDAIRHYANACKIGDDILHPKSVSAYEDAQKGQGSYASVVEEKEVVVEEKEVIDETIDRIPIATCGLSNPVDCAVDYLKDNYNIKWYTSSDDLQTYQNTKTKDYVIDVTIKGENLFGGEVVNTFRVTVDQNSKYIYSCVRK